MTADSLTADLAAHIASHDSTQFEPLALRVFAYQYENNKPYRAFCDGRGKTPATVTRWQDIPPAPAAAFKRFALTCADPALCTPEHGGRTFHSSGTTGSETSRHFMDANALELYRLSLKEGYAYFALQETTNIVALMPPPQDAPHSSLSFMLEEMKGDFWMNDNPVPWIESVLIWFRTQRKPYTIFGTAFAWVQLLDTMEENIPLPEGCFIVETGGFKGRSREVSRDELYTLFTELLSVPPTHCIAEYGMSEMASQFYDTTYRDHLRGLIREPRKAALPHLLRTRVVDPITDEEAEPGQPGLLAHYDVANLNSVLAIQTEDYGYAMPDGEGFTLLGRAPSAALRGCSLTAEEFAARQRNG